MLILLYLFISLYVVAQHDKKVNKIKIVLIHFNFSSCNLVYYKFYRKYMITFIIII